MRTRRTLVMQAEDGSQVLIMLSSDRDIPTHVATRENEYRAWGPPMRVVVDEEEIREP